MAIAAVPTYIQKDDPEFYLTAPPGHRFLLYFPMWGENGETGQIDWRSKDKVEKYKKQQGEFVDDGWTDIENGQFANTIAAAKVPAYFEETPRSRKPKNDPGLKPWLPMMEALLKRQGASFSGNQGVVLEALSTAPFTTGLGNEHPTENGFAFLNPYGLPYLPGSGVKGVLRQAARELASGDWGEKLGWSEEKAFSLKVDNKTTTELSVLDVLFGKESKDGDKEHVRGALTFWDVIPQIKGDSLAVEIMTPHQKHYYQDGKTPHDSGQPVPISFLTVPPGSGFTFHVQCNQALLKNIAPELENQWQTLLQAAFGHAFNWLGFGAKTAVGYGVMVDKKQFEETKDRQQKQNLEAAGIDVGAFDWEGALIVSYNAGAGEIQLKSTDGKLASGSFYSALSGKAKKRLKSKKDVYVNARVEKTGNQLVIQSITELD